MTYREAIQQGTQKLADCGIVDAQIDARELLFFATGLEYSTYLAKMGDVMEEDDYVRYHSFLVQRGNRIPLQHIIGSTYFMGYSFHVNSDVLIPRQDTETLVELAEKEISKLRRENPQVQPVKLLDMCTGSGCIGLSLKKRSEERQEQLDVTLSDLSEKALAVAEKNRQGLGVEAKLVQSDLFQEIPETYDVIVSNPPYIPSDVIEGLEKEVKDHDPMLALDGGEDGLSIYRRQIPEAYFHLREGGSLLLEIGYDQGESVRNIMMEASFSDIEIRKDLSQNDRVVIGRKR